MSHRVWQQLCQLDVRESCLFPSPAPFDCCHLQCQTDKNTSAANSVWNRLKEGLILMNSLMTVCVEASQGRRRLPHMDVELISHGKSEKTN